MLKIKFFSVFFFLTSLLMFSQGSLNDYKYVIVPSQYDFQKSEDSYQINSLTKFLFNKAGFTAILNNENLPDDLARNRCLALTAQLNKGKGLFATKMYFDLINCKNEVVYSTKEAVSREKDYKKAYHEVIRKSLDVKFQNYKYNQKNTDKIVAVTENNNATNNKIDIKEVINRSEPIKVENAINLLYAQPVKNGFQLVDSTPKRIYIIKRTSVKDVFILEDKNGILYKSGNYWIAEYYEGNQPIEEKLNIKF